MKGANSSHSCVDDCDSGFELQDTQTGNCVKCPKGKYRTRGKPDQRTCVVCDNDRYTTVGEGSVNNDDCNISVFGQDRKQDRLLILVKMSHRKLTIDQVLEQVLSDDDGSLNVNDYLNDSDFAASTTNSSSDMEPENILDNRPVHVAHGRERRGAVNTRQTEMPPGWTRDTTKFRERVFSPKVQPGPRNIPDSINADSTPLFFFFIVLG
ncbi:hypothetical protein ScPMuIL_004108 [Solemya velum]